MQATKLVIAATIVALAGVAAMPSGAADEEDIGECVLANSGNPAVCAFKCTPLREGDPIPETDPEQERGLPHDCK